VLTVKEGDKAAPKLSLDFSKEETEKVA